MFENVDSTIIIAIVTSISAIMGAVVAGLFQLRKNKADSTKTNADTVAALVDATLTILEPYKEEVINLRKANKELVQLNLELKESNAELKQDNLILKGLLEEFKEKCTELETLLNERKLCLEKKADKET